MFFAGEAAIKQPIVYRLGTPLSIEARLGSRSHMTLIFAAAAAGIAALLIPTPALAWGPVTHVALGMQVLASLVADAHPLYAALEAFPEVFLYGSLAPDIVQGRRLQSRLRRHSHNWAVGLDLIESAVNNQERAFAYGYLAHLGADVVAHNFFLPARLIGRFDSRLSGHIYYEARFDSIHAAAYRELLLSLLDIDFRSVDATLARAVDSPLISFRNHRRIFEGGLKRIRHMHRVIAMLGGPAEVDHREAELYSSASCEAISAILEHRADAPVCGFDPMGQHAVRTASQARTNLRRLGRMGARARLSAKQVSQAMVEELRRHLAQTRFKITAI